MPPRPRIDDRLADELAARRAEHGTNIFLQVNEPEAVALACGFIPPSVRHQARAAIDWHFKPARKAPRRQSGGRRNEPQRGRDDQDGRRRRDRRHKGA